MSYNNLILPCFCPSLFPLLLCPPQLVFFSLYERKHKVFYLSSPYCPLLLPYLSSLQISFFSLISPLTGHFQNEKSPIDNFANINTKICLVTIHMPQSISFPPYPYCLGPGEDHNWYDFQLIHKWWILVKEKFHLTEFICPGYSSCWIV